MRAQASSSGKAVQIAAAPLWLKARQVAPGAHPERLNLVASCLRLAALLEDIRRRLTEQLEKGARVRLL